MYDRAYILTVAADLMLAHNKSFHLSCLAAVLISASSFAATTAQDWAAVTIPTTSSNGQSIGAYNSGCLSGAVALPISGSGYQVMRLSRNRYYGHPLLIEFIQQLGQIADAENLGTLLIGDLAQPRGGPTLNGHRSHQTGLDVDIWFLLSEKLNNRLLTHNERETWNAPSMVDIKADTVDYQRWTRAHEKILELAASQQEVDRIFVNPSIKQALCEHKTDSSAGWLRKIRPWWKHDDHFHVRLKCPKDNLHCEGQETLPEGDGCDAGLAWWFSKEAKAPTKHAPPIPPPPLPALCEQVLNQ
ncbi:penicillin-insensitive murein DD-endopeptidase [Methylococcales bacterium]|nr:penicillin-insensitive murein DD-endopeptidase [Methylococcales bacterium]